MADFVRGSSLVNVPELITAHGGDPRRMIAEAGVDAAAVGDYNQFILYSQLSLIVGRSAEELGVTDFGLRLSRLQDLEMLGPIAVLTRNSENVEAALLGVIKHLHTYSPAIEATLHTGPRESTFTFAITLHRLPYRSQMIELALGVILGMFQLLVDSNFHPNRMLFRHGGNSPLDVYIDYFQCPVLFDQDVNALVFPTALLARKIDGGDGQARALAARFLGSQRPHDTIDEQVYELVGKLMPLGEGTLPSVAYALALHPRALQRRLEDAETTFEKVLDNVRRHLALDLLATPSASLSTISDQLGYSEQSTLTRSCRRWFGQAPLAMRRQLRGVGKVGEKPSQAL